MSAPRNTPEQRDNWRGILWMMSSVVIASIMSIAVRYASYDISSILIVLYRAIFATLIVCAAIVIYPPWRKQIKFSHPLRHIIRGLCVATATNLGFYTLATVPIATSTVLFFTAPIFATLLGMVFHKEPIGIRRISAIGCGFLGALVILRPGFSEISWGMLAGISSSIFFALALTMSRGLAQADGAISTYLSSVVITFLVTLPFAVPNLAVPQNTIIWLAVGVVSITSILRGIADIQAYRYAEASVLTPVAYSRIVFLGIAGYFLFNETPDKYTLIGAFIIISSTLYITQRERALKAAKPK
ncbi:MAG: multidrug DMT transporter permease [Rhodobacteraceae bacterium]|nr:MAG: multidrug DMT transporter permease [Paracoccaceae bacterium]